VYCIPAVSICGQFTGNPPEETRCSFFSLKIQPNFQPFTKWPDINSEDTQIYSISVDPGCFDHCGFGAPLETIGINKGISSPEIISFGRVFYLPRPSPETISFGWIPNYKS
jgi:hypothetical protein